LLFAVKHWGLYFPVIMGLRVSPFQGIQTKTKTVIKPLEVWKVSRIFFQGFSMGIPINQSVFHGIWSNYSDLTRVFTPNGGLVREIPLFQGNLGWCNIIIWPDGMS